MHYKINNLKIYKLWVTYWLENEVIKNINILDNLKSFLK